MNISNQRKDEICSVFQRAVKHGNSEKIDSISLDELKQVDVKLGKRDINASYRHAMKKMIEKLETGKSQKEQRKYDSKIRAWKLVTGLILVIAAAGLAKWLFG